MNDKRLWVALWIALVLALPSGVLLATPGDPVVKYSSDQVRLYTDVEKDKAQWVVSRIAFFEAFIEDFFQQYGISQKRDNPIRCRLFKDYKEFQEFRRKENIQSYAGAYFSQHNNRIIAPYGEGGSSDFALLLHECAHQVLRRYFNDPPRWFDEGFATYFDGAAFDPHDNLISMCRDSRRLAMMRFLISDHLLTEWKVFFDYENETAWRNAVDDGSLNVTHFYAQAWGTVFFYLHTEEPDARKLFTKFLKGMNTGRSRPEMILKDLAKRTGSFPGFYQQDHRQRLTLFNKASSAYETRDLEKAMEYLAHILEIDDQHRATWRLAAEVCWCNKEYASSLTFWESLAEKDRKNSFYQWKICRCLVEVGLAENSPERFSEAIKLGKAAVKLTRSKNPHCYAALAMAYFADGQVRQALGAIRNANRYKCESSEEYKQLEKRYSETLLNR